MWILNVTILFLLMQNCSTTKLIDLPDSEDYEEGLKYFDRDIKKTTRDYPLKKYSSETASRYPKEIKKSSSDRVDSEKIERSSPNAKNTRDPKAKERRSNHLLLSQSYKEHTRRFSVIEPEITISRERKSHNRDLTDKRHDGHRQHSASLSSRESSNRGSKKAVERSFHSPIYRESSKESINYNDGSNTARRANDLDKYDTEKDENIKKKLSSLVEQTLHDTEKKMESIQHIKLANRDFAPYKIGFILSMVKKSRDMLNELFNTAVKHRDSWRALEQLKIFELIAHTNVDTTNLVRQLVELHIQHINSTLSHSFPPYTPPPEGERKRVVLL